MRKLFALVLLVTSLNALAIDRRGRLGVGYTNQLSNDIPAISFKMHANESFAYGGYFGISTDDNTGGYGAGVKIYSTLFNEPRLSFYAAAGGALVKSNSPSADSSNGFQFDFTLGSEFSFQQINSIGFSFEMGISINNSDGFVVETVGSSFLTAGVHFYI